MANVFPTSISSEDFIEEKFQSKLSTNGDFIFGTLLVFIGILSIFGNGSSLAIFYSRRQRLSPAEIFLVNLAIVDILLSVASYPCVMISAFKHKWIFGSTVVDIGCTLYAFVCYFFGLASISSLMALAVIRYLKTCRPVTGAQINNSLAAKIISWIYVYALGWACLPLIGIGGYDVEPFGISCTLEWMGNGLVNRWHIILVSLFCVFLPIIVMLFCYLKIVMLVRESSDVLKVVHKQTSQVSDIQLTWMTGLVCCGFVISWAPYAIVSLWGTICQEILLPIWATPLPVLLAKSSIAFNPIIYIFMTKRYREDFISLMQSFRTHQRANESATSARKEVAIAISLNSVNPSLELVDNFSPDCQTSTLN